MSSAVNIVQVTRNVLHKSVVGSSALREKSAWRMVEGILFVIRCVCFRKNFPKEFREREQLC